MNTVVINMGGTDYSIQYYFDINNELIIDSIQMHGIEVISLLTDESYEKLKEIITEKWA